MISKTVIKKWNVNNKKRFISKGYAFTKYDDTFEVDVKDLAKSDKTKVRVKCDYCGKEFEQAYSNYLNAVKNINKSSCKKCVGKKSHEQTLSKRQGLLFEKLNKACEIKGYELLSRKEDIVNNTTYIDYECPIHGRHSMRVANMIRGKGCPECAKDYTSKKFRLSIEEVVKRISDCGGTLLNKDEYINKYTKNLLVKCPTCGTPFITSLVLFIQHQGQQCEECRKRKSLGEQKVESYLIQNDIKYIPQKWFDDCRDIYPLPFDFWIPDLNTMIEFDGRQHFEETNYFHHSYEKINYHDLIKNTYCKEHGIDMIRIPYWESNKIDTILNEKLLT